MAGRTLGCLFVGRGFLIIVIVGGHRFLNYCVDIGGGGDSADGVSDILLQWDPKSLGINRITTIPLCDDCLFWRR